MGYYHSRKRDKVQIRKATLDDLDAIKRIADANKDSLGFVLRPALQEAIEQCWLLVAELDGQIVGFCNYRHRRDGQTTIYEICVSEAHRGCGIGKALIAALVQESQSVIHLKAIAGIPANGFYEHVGFVLAGTEVGRKQPLNVWRLDRGPHLLFRSE